MTGIYDVEPNALIEKAAEELKKVDAIKPPTWSSYVKTGHFRQRPPIDRDWWYIRSAAILRAVYMLGPIGTQKLRTKYGGKKDRGHKTEHYFKGSGSIIRKILQQLEKAGFIKKGDKGVHKGRVITGAGTSFLHKAAKAIQGKKESKMSEVSTHSTGGKQRSKKDDGKILSTQSQSKSESHQPTGGSLEEEAAKQKPKV